MAQDTQIKRAALWSQDQSGNLMSKPVNVNNQVRILPQGFSQVGSDGLYNPGPLAMSKNVATQQLNPPGPTAMNRNISLKSPQQPVTPITSNRNLSIAPQTMQEQPIQPQIDAQQSFQDEITKLLQGAQQQPQGTDEDLMTQRNALVNARFGVKSAITPEELRVLTPAQQQALRNQDVKGMEDQLAGVDAALDARDKTKQIQSSMQTADYKNWVLSGQPGTFQDWYKKTNLGDLGLTATQATMFNNIVSKYNASPLVLASDRLPVLQNSIKDIRKNPSNGALQLNLAYSYVQALDTYQSAVREGELALVNSIDSKVGQVGNWITQIQNGQIMRPEVALQIADSANKIVETIAEAAKSKAKSFESQASVVGLQDAWNQYIKGFSPNYSSSNNELKSQYESMGYDESWEEAIKNYTITELQNSINSELNKKKISMNSESGMRTDRNNNPTAFTTDIAKQAGLEKGVDYIDGSPFPSGNLVTARLLKDPVETTINVLDKIGFYTQSGKPRWTHIAMDNKTWQQLPKQKKIAVVYKMYQNEGNQGALNQYFKNYA